MKKWLAFFRIYSLKDFSYLVYAMVIDSFFKRIPKDVFILKNTYDFVSKKKGFVNRGLASTSISYEGHQFVLRNKGSDFKVFTQIIIDGGVSIVVERLKLLKISNPTIMDCGANIGLYSLMMKKNFPASRIVSIEPDPDNFRQLEQNISLNNLRDVTLLQGGIWFEDTFLALNREFGDGSDWAVALAESIDKTKNTIQVYSPATVVNQLKWDTLDVIKIDIEGSEFPLFRNLSAWENILDKVKIISVEVHENVGSLFEIAEILMKKGFILERSGELLIGLKN